jgi:ThiF family
MSQQLINRSSDLRKLRDDGYEIEIRANNYLLIHGVPYLNSNKEIKKGTLVSVLTLAGDVTTNNVDHVVHFIGEFPCNKDGTEINPIRHQTLNQNLADNLFVNFSFSNKPADGYKDYYEKMSSYIRVISDPAVSIDKSVSAKTFKFIEFQDDESVFNYSDTNSSRAGIDVITDKLKNQKIGIVGLGGTGSYILDLIAKTPVNEIHLYDGDFFLRHNAFRSPGAASIEVLNEQAKKTDYLRTIYSRMHKNIFSHDCFINSSNIDQLLQLNFVFMCIDKGDVKRLIFKTLKEANITVIDAGIGVEAVDNSLIGIVRVTTSTGNKSDHLDNRIDFSGVADDNDYSKNIQIAELNSLAASLAVIKWKKLSGFYQDLENEHNTTYSLNVNMLQSEEIP